jgi:hypothetical protein
VNIEKNRLKNKNENKRVLTIEWTNTATWLMLFSIQDPQNQLSSSGFAFNNVNSIFHF